MSNQFIQLYKRHCFFIYLFDLLAIYLKKVPRIAYFRNYHQLLLLEQLQKHQYILHQQYIHFYPKHLQE
jgi:hypothetical protein